MVRKKQSSLRNICVVLVRAGNPLNIGQAARAMKNFGVSRLVLAGCAPHKTEEAYTVGWKAREILDGAECCGALQDIAGRRDFTVGFTTRMGRERGDARPFPDVLPRILTAAEKRKVFLVFGNEKNGLSNEELARCFMTAAIPAHTEYSSLNLSHAVAVALSQIFASVGESSELFRKPEEAYPSPAHFETLLGELRETMLAAGYRPGKAFEGIHKHLSDYFRRTGMDKTELHLLRAFFRRLKIETAGRRRSS